MQQSNQTLGIIKPDATLQNKIGAILAMVEKDGFSIKKLRKLRLNREQAMEFYAVHKERPFFNELVDYMTSGSIVAFVAEINDDDNGTDAIEKYRTLIGSTDPSQAAEGSIRKAYGTDKSQNAVHGSDSAENAVNEIAFFFPPNEE